MDLNSLIRISFNSLSRDHRLAKLVGFDVEWRSHLSTPSLGITSVLQLLAARLRHDCTFFQLPLSGSPSFRISALLKLYALFQLPLSGSLGALSSPPPGRAPVLPLSTPSLGITNSPSMMANLWCIRYLSTPSLGITNQ